MKKQIVQNIAKKFFLFSLLAVAVIVSANASTGSTSASSDKAEVKYTGTDKDNQLSFNVKYANPNGNTFALTVLDESGEQLYKSFYGDKQFDKTFKLPKLDNTRYTFVIQDAKTAYKEKFDVSFKTEVIENVVVNKAN